MPFKKDGIIYTLDQIKAEHPNTSFLATTPAELGYTFVPDPEPTLADEIAAKRNAINWWRDAEEEKPLTWNGHRWQMRRADREKIMGVALAGVAPPHGYWTDADDSDVPMTSADMQALYGAGMQRIADIHAHQRARKAALAALSDIAAVRAFDPAEGWEG